MNIIGKIIGNRPGGRIVVETLDLDIYVLDRFALIRKLFDNVCLFELPESQKKGDYDA